MEKIKIRVALIGCGMISDIYCQNLTKMDIFDFVGVSDLIPERAQKRAEQYGVRAMTNEQIFADPSISLVINTTYPLSHYEVARQALLAGKHVYTEKMICETMEQANELQALAQEKGLYCGGAPDTFLSGAFQVARGLIDAGMIGAPTMVEIFLARSYHHERYYTGDEKRFAFCRHGGILFDMGAYYLSAAVFLLGSIRQVCGFVDTRDPDRIYENPNSPHYGEPMTVETPNSASGSLRFACGALGQIVMTSEGGAGGNHFVIYGTDGKLDLGDPNEYEGVVRLYNKKGEESIVHTPHAYTNGNYRVMGAAEAMYALAAGRTPRCSGDLCRHVPEATLGICDSSKTGRTYTMTTTVARPEPLPLGYTEYPELSLKK